MSLRIYLYILLFIFVNIASKAQENDELFNRMQGIHNANGDFLNVDGIEVYIQKKDGELSVKNILKKFKKFPLSEKQLTRDSTLDLGNFYAYVREDKPGVVAHSSYYFFEDSHQKIAGILFTSVNKQDKNLEAEIVRLVSRDGIPERIFTPAIIDTINFAGRPIDLGSACHWRGINNIQCPGKGQMNWSVHKTGEDATITVNSKVALIADLKQGLIISDTVVNVTFEGGATTARKLIYDIKGVNSALVGMSGGKTLTIYAIAAPVRGNWVSCVMSHWNNDSIMDNGLPPLIGEVMELQR